MSPNPLSAALIILAKKKQFKVTCCMLVQTKPTNVTLLKFNFQYTGERIRISVFRVRATYCLEKDNKILSWF